MVNQTKVEIVGLYGKRLDSVLKEWQQKNPERVIQSVVPTLTDNPKHSNYAQELREVAIISVPTPSPLNDLGKALLMIADLNRKVGDDADRIAAAVAVLRGYNAITQNSYEPIRRAIAILEGRDQG